MCCLSLSACKFTLRSSNQFRFLLAFSKQQNVHEKQDRLSLISTLLRSLPWCDIQNARYCILLRISLDSEKCQLSAFSNKPSQHNFTWQSLQHAQKNNINEGPVNKLFSCQIPQFILLPAQSYLITNITSESVVTVIQLHQTILMSQQQYPGAAKAE